jgi:hypothetical protein
VSPVERGRAWRIFAAVVLIVLLLAFLASAVLGPR